MNTLEKIVITSFGLVALYLMLNSRNTSTVFTSLAGGYSNILTTLQGRDATGIQV